MADAAARRREARRRKLLMSSEDRMNKILQLNTQTKRDQESASETADIPQGESGRDSAIEHTRVLPQPIPKTKEVISTQPSTSSLEHQTTGKDVTAEQVLDKPSFPYKSSAESSLDERAPTSARRASGDAIVLEEQNSSKSIHKSNANENNFAEKNLNTNEKIDSTEEEEEGHSAAILTRRTHLRTSTPDGATITQTLRHGPESSHQSTQDSRSSSPEPVKQTSNAERQQKTRKGQLVAGREVGCVFLAVAMRCMLACDWLMQYTGQSIIIPFLALQLMLAVLTSNKPKTEGGGFLLGSISMALMLCKVPQETISRATRIMAVFATVFADLTLYLFTFIMLHCVLEVFG